MTKRSIWVSLFALLAVFALLLGSTQLAKAQEVEVVEIAGTVMSIDTEAGTFVVVTPPTEEFPEGVSYTVTPPEGFDFTLLEAGVTVVYVTGTLNAEDGSFTATEVLIDEDGVLDPPEEDEGPVPGEGDDEAYGGVYCSTDDPELQHPFGARLAETYEVDYETLKAWFCEGYGWGQVMLALQTSKVVEGTDPQTLLDARAEGDGWGIIWQELGLIGKPKDAEAPNDEDDDGRPGKSANPVGIPLDLDGDGRPDIANPKDVDGDGIPDKTNNARPDAPGQTKDKKDKPEKPDNGKP